MEIKKGNNKFYIGETEESWIAKITWVDRGDKVIAVDHTIVDPSLRGQGVAGRLLQHVIDMARNEDIKIIPVCSYVVKKMTRNDEYEDILYKK